MPLVSATNTDNGLVLAVLVGAGDTVGTFRVAARTSDRPTAIPEGYL